MSSYNYSKHLQVSDIVNVRSKKTVGDENWCFDENGNFLGYESVPPRPGEYGYDQPTPNHK